MPRKIIVIGTLHAGITPNNELKAVIESFKPDQLLVEIANDDITKNDLIELVNNLAILAAAVMSVYGIGRKIYYKLVRRNN